MTIPVALLAIALSVVTTGKWPGFLGPVDPSLKADQLPLKWSAEDHIAWTAKLSGYGQSSPVVWNDQIIITTIEGPKKEQGHVTSLDPSTGRERWKRTIPMATQIENTDYVSRAAPTPIVDDEGIVAFFEGGNLLALTPSGEIVWQRDLVAEFGEIKSRHGISSSPVRDGNRIFVWVPRDQDPYLIAVDRSTGKDLWRISTPKNTAWSSPAVLPLDGGVKHLVLSSNGSLVGYSVEDGQELWKLEGLTGNTTPTPQVIGPGRLLLGASAGRDGGSTKEVARTNGLVAVEKKDGQWQAAFLWQCSKATCSFNSPALHQGLVYFVNRQGVLVTVDVETGEEVYTERLDHPVWATPLGIGSRVYLVGEEGVTTVISAGRKYEVLATNRLWEPAPAQEGATGPQAMLGKTRQYAVAAIPGKLLIRRGDRLYCISN